VWVYRGMRAVVLALLVVVTVAVPVGRLAAEDRQPIRLAVGQTVAREVGYAMGHLCDDETVVRAEMKNGTVDDNLFVVTGLRPGTTLCRAGTEQNRPTVLFEITVAPAAPTKPAPR
jgi:hypothetical protein